MPECIFTSIHSTKSRYTPDNASKKCKFFIAFFPCISCVMESFDCLAMVTRLNHKLLEPWLPSLWLCLMVTHPTLDADPLGQECVTIFAKLRQVNFVFVSFCT